MNRPMEILRLFSCLIGLVLRRKSYGTFMKIYTECKFDSGFVRSYSQFGEDLALMFYLGSESQKSFIDVGCNDPNRFSNTRLLHEAGWVGLNIDANPEFEKAYSKFRPGSKFVNALVGTSKTPVSFYMFRESALDTTDETMAMDHINNAWQLLEERQIQPQTLNDIILKECQNATPTLLSLDCEGAEIDVLNSLDMQIHRPKWILFESVNYSLLQRDESVVNYLKEKGYSVMCTLPQSTLMTLNP